MVYCAGKLTENLKCYFIKTIQHTFYGFTGVISHLGSWENTRKACTSLLHSAGVFLRLSAELREAQCRTSLYHEPSAHDLQA